MTDEELKALVASLAVSQAKTDEQMARTDEELKALAASVAKSQAKTDEQMARTDKKLDKLGKLVGSITNNQGDVAEEFFWNSISAHPVLAGITYDFTDKNAARKKGAVEDEYDILMVNGRDVAIIETKYKAHENDIKKLIDKKYPNFKKLYPEYSNYNHHLAIASFYIDKDTKNKALESNIMVLQRKGDLIETSLP